jgi:hypothetical protein
LQKALYAEDGTVLDTYQQSHVFVSSFLNAGTTYTFICR